MLSFRGRAFRRVGAVISLALFLTLQLFTSSETLHKLIHPDADSPDHECAITLFHHGQVDTTSVFVPLVAFVAALLFVLSEFRPPVFSSFDYRFAFSRAPPLV